VGHEPVSAWTGRIHTFSGKRFAPLNPDPDDICIEDIAHSLSQQCRFTGHTRKPYSIAQHSYLVSVNCASEDALWGLMHDASEAYLCDIASPVKHSDEMGGYRLAELNLMEVICHKYGLPLDMPESVKVADRRMLITEARDLMPPADWYELADCYGFTVFPWSAVFSERKFLERYEELTSGK